LAQGPRDKVRGANLKTMSFPKSNGRETDNALMPRRDRSASATRSKAPPVPKAPRPAQKPQSAGAFVNEHKRGSPASSGYTAGMVPKASEERRPREESPFARINMLSRERESTDNQEIEVGPARRRSERPPSAEKPNFSRGHVLGKETNAQQGIHWSGLTTSEEAPRATGKRSVMQREFKDAPQSFEWRPEESKLPVAVLDRDHSRKSTLAREQAAAADEGHPDKVPPSQANGNYARRNVLSREAADVGSSLNMPKASGTEEGGAPVYRRRSSLQSVAGIGGS